MSISGLKDVDREILKHLDDEKLLKICTLDRKTWNEVCDDNFLRRRLMKYPGIEKYKLENESWKRFYLRVLYYVSKMQEEYEYTYKTGNFKVQYDLLKNYKMDKLLIEAARKGEVEIVKHAIENGANVHTAADYPLKLAVYAGNLDLVKLLLASSDNVRDDIAFRWASVAGKIDIVKYLVEKGVDIHLLNDTAFRMASFEGQLPVVKYLVGKGANMHINNEEALRTASLHGHFDVVKYLVDQGADVNGQNGDALSLASAHGNLDIVKYLVEHGAEVHINNDDAIKWARKNGHTEVLNYLLSHT